tara:strand:+ start:332 stop:1600 length:1269 start_codon:yes stop_codon:yes gene_type:complete
MNQNISKNKLYFNKKRLKKIYNYCRVCNNTGITNVLSLQKTPLEDQFLKSKTKQHKYSLKLFICKKCNYLFLNEILNENSSYKYYLYNSEVTLGLKKHYDKYSSKLISKEKLNFKKFVIDIGSNDGTFLNFFKKKGISVLGVEPAKRLALIAKKKKIETFNDFFNFDNARAILNKYGQADVISCNYTFANIREINEFLRAINIILKDKGLFVIETGYYPLQFQKNMFDYIYHEHYSYYSITFLNSLFHKFDLKIIDVEFTKPKGGSIRVYVRKNKKKIITLNKKIKNLMGIEKKNKIFSKNYFINFNKRIEKQKILTNNFLTKVKKSKNQIIGYGASHSTTVLLHHFNIGKKLAYIVDDNKIKHKLYSPGFHLKVYPSTKIHKEKYIIILAWQHAKNIIEKNKIFKKNNGKFIIPLPNFRIL